MKKLIIFLWLMILFQLVYMAYQLDNLNRQLATVNQELTTISQRLDKPAEIVYQVDSYGGTWQGKITDKEIKNNRYGVEVGNYGWFMVTKEQYEALNIGDDAPEELKERGN